MGEENLDLELGTNGELVLQINEETPLARIVGNPSLLFANFQLGIFHGEIDVEPRMSPLLNGNNP